MASTIFERMRGDAASGWALETAGIGESSAAASTLSGVIKFVDTWDPLFGPASANRWARDLHGHLEELCQQLEQDFSNFLGWFLVALSVLLSLAVHYTLASCVSWNYYRRNL